MKKSKRILTLFVMLIVLVVGATSLVACSDKKGKKMTDEDFTNMLNNGVEMAVSPSNGWYFNIDAKVSVTYEKDGAKSKYDLTVKGTLDTNPQDQATYDNQLFLQLTESKNDGAAKVLLGLYYSEQECNDLLEYDKKAPQLYMELDGGKYKFAYDAYSIKKLVRDVTPATANSADIGETIKGIVPAIFAAIAVPDTYKIRKVDKTTVETTVELSLAKLFGEGGLVSGLLDSNREVIEGIIGKDGIDLNLTVDDLMNLKINMPITLTCQYESAKKGAFGKFKNASLKINVAEDHDITIKAGDKYIVSGDMNNNPIIPFPTLIPKCNLTIAVEKLVIESTEKLAIDFPSYDGYTKINIANIDISGKIRFADNKKPDIKPGQAPGTEYDLIIKADINPIPLAWLGDTRPEIKQKMFESIGMLHIAIITPNRANALLQIVYDPEHTGGDYAYLDLGILNTKIGLRMDASSLEGLFTVMVNFINGKYPAKAQGMLSTVADGDVNNIAPDLGAFIKDLCGETVKSIIDMIDPKLWDKDIDGNPDTADSVGNTIKKIGNIVGDLTATNPGAVKLGTVERPNQKNAFVELNLGKILDTISTAFALPASTIDLIKNLLPQVLPGDILNLEFTGISYGTVEASYDAAQFLKKGQTAAVSPDKQVGKILGVPGTNSDGVLKISKSAFKAQYATFESKVTLVCNNILGKKINSNYTVYFATYDENSTAVQDVTVAVRSTDGNISTITSVISSFAKDLPLGKYPLGFESVTFKVQLT